MSRMWKDEAEYDAWNKQKEQSEFERAAYHKRRASGYDTMHDYEGLEPLEWRSGYLWGPAGVGKTYTASRMVVAAKAAFVKASDYIHLARLVELDRTDDDEDRRYARIRRASHLVIDDLGTRKPSDFAYETIYEIIDSRLSRSETLITSNVSLDQIAEIYDDRVASRIAAMGEVVHLTGPDRRLKP